MSYYQQGMVRGISPSRDTSNRMMMVRPSYRMNDNNNNNSVDGTATTTLNNNNSEVISHNGGNRRRGGEYGPGTGGVGGGLYGQQQEEEEGEHYYISRPSNSISPSCKSPGVTATESPVIRHPVVKVRSPNICLAIGRVFILCLTLLVCLVIAATWYSYGIMWIFDTSTKTYPILTCPALSEMIQITQKLYQGPACKLALQYSLDLSNYIKSEGLDLPPGTPPTESLGMCTLASSEETPITCYLPSPCTSVCREATTGGLCPDPLLIKHVTTPDANNQRCYVFLRSQQVYYQMNCYEIQQASHCTYYFTVTPSNILAIRGLILAVAFITIFWFIGELVLRSVEKGLKKEEEEGMTRMAAELPSKRRYLRDQISQRWAEEADINYALSAGAPSSMYDNNNTYRDAAAVAYSDEHDYYYNNNYRHHYYDKRPGDSSTRSNFSPNDNSRRRSAAGGGSISGYTNKYNGKSQLYSRDPRKRFESNAWRRRLHQWKNLGNDRMKKYVARQRIRTLLLTLFYILLIICSQFLVIFFSPHNAQPLESITSAFLGVISIWNATSWLDWIIFVDVLLDVLLFIAAAIAVKWPTQGVFAHRLQAELRDNEIKGDDEDEEEDEEDVYYDDRSITDSRANSRRRSLHSDGVLSYDDDEYGHDDDDREWIRDHQQHHERGGNNEASRGPSLTQRRLQQLNKADDSTPYATRVLKQQQEYTRGRGGGGGGGGNEGYYYDDEVGYNDDNKCPPYDDYDDDDDDDEGSHSLVSSSIAVTSTLPSSEDTATVDFVLSQGMTRDVCLMIACHNSAMTVERFENHVNMLRAALCLFPPSHIFVCDNSSSMQPPDENMWACEQVHPDINYLYVPEGNKTFAFYWCNKYWIPFLQQNDRIPSFKYAVIIDDDVVLPPDLHIPHQLLDQNPNIKAVHFPIGATTANAESNVLVGCQDCEYRLAAVHKQFQATLASAISCHGAVALWDRETLDEVLYDHDTVFHGEDLQMGMNLLKKRDDSRIISAAQTLVPTFAPDTWAKLFRQRVKSWDVTAHRKTFMYLIEIINPAGWCHLPSWVLKPYFVQELLTICLDWLRIFLLFGLLCRDYLAFFIMLAILIMLVYLMIFALNYIVLRQRRDLRLSPCVMFIFPWYRFNSLLYRIGALCQNVLVYSHTRVGIKLSVREDEIRDIPPCPPSPDVDWFTVWTMDTIPPLPTTTNNNKANHNNNNNHALTPSYYRRPSPS